MKWLNCILRLVLGLLVLVLITEVIRVSKLDSTVGQVHLWRDRQILSGNPLLEGPVGRLAANKWLVAVDETENKLLEIMDINIVFFAGHPNERSNVREGEKLPWLLLPLVAVAIWQLLRKEKTAKLLAVVVLVNLAWAMRQPVIDDQALKGSLMIYIGLMIYGAKTIFDYLKRKIK